MKEYLLAFVIGSSIFSYVLFVLSLSRLPRDYYNFSGYVYYIIVPIYFGIMNMLSLFVANRFKLSKFHRLILTTLVSSFIVITLVYSLKLYNWKDKNKKYIYPFMNLAGHLSTYFIIIYLLETYIK